MKTIWTHLFATALLCGCGATAPSGDSDAAAYDIESAAALDEVDTGGLSRAEAAMVLDAIDDICGDTWCEGDHDFRFRRLRCEPRTSTCSLFFLMFPHGTAPTFASWRTCKTGDYAGLASLVETDARGVVALTPAYYETLTTCIAGLESSRDPGQAELL
jgi:hypothetical protein